MLVRGSRDRVAAWVRRGTVPCQVAGDDGWWGVVPAGPSRADDVSAATLPVIATRPVPQWLRPGVGLFVVDGRAPASVADTLIGLLKDPAGARAMGERGRAWIEREWRWDAVADRFAALLSDAADLRDAGAGP